VICPECLKAGKTPERVYDGGLSTTLMGWQPYWGTEGRRHSHDPNRKTHGFRCSNGHWWTEIRGETCWCGWRSMYADRA
jgi:hypothetical protein